MAQELPEVKRSVTLDTSVGVPDFGAAARDVGDASNWMSSFGAKVSQSASMEMAARMGYEQGKNPSGSLAPPITDFDKHYANAYITQSNATLNLQADKLLTDSQLELAKANRLSPELIAKNQKQVAEGLEKITQLAPTQIKGEMEAKFGALMLDSNYKLNSKLIAQQRQDTRNTYLLSAQKSQENIYELSHGGNFEAAKSAVESVKRDMAVARQQGYVTSIEEQAAIKTVDKINKIGQYTNLYAQAEKEGKGPEFLKKFATEKPENLSYQDWPMVGQGIAQYAQQMQNLRSQDEMLRMTKFNESLVVDPLNITSEQWADLKSNLSPNNYEKMVLAATTKIAAAQKKKKDYSSLANNFTDSVAFADATDDQKNGAFNLLVEQGMKDAEARGSAASIDDIKRNVAANAPGPIPRYMKELETKILNGDDIEGAGTAIDFIRHSGHGQNVDINKNALAVLEVYRGLRGKYETTKEAQQVAHDIVFNKDQDQRDANSASLSAFNKDLSSQGKKTSFYVSMAAIPSGAEANMSDIAFHAEKTFNAYYQLTNGDVAAATKMTQDDFNSSYGVTTINGKNEYSYMPLEKTLGLPPGSNGVIQSDVASQANLYLGESRKQFDEGKRDDYWEIVPGMTTSEAKEVKGEINKIRKLFEDSPILERTFDISKNREKLIRLEKQMDAFNQGKGIKAVRYWRNAQPEIMELGIRANPWSKKTGNADVPIVGGWDIVVKTPNGNTPIPMLDPMFQFPSYIPNKTDLENDITSINSNKSFLNLENINPADLLSQYYK